MQISIIILIVVLILILVTQVISLYIQYRVNRTYRGIGDWLLGSSLMTLGFIFMPMINVKSLEMLAKIANPLIVLGHIFLYIGIKKFLNKKLNKWIPISIFAVFNVFYYYHIYITNSISARSLTIGDAIAIISFMIAYELFLAKDRLIAHTAKFNGAVFLIYGCYYIVHNIQIMIEPSANSYSESGSILILAFVISIVLSNLWTFGLIMMVNQRLNIDNTLEKEKLQLIFNTNIDAQLITRLEDGLVLDVNNEFSILSGYSKAEIIGDFLQSGGLWHSPGDREIFVTELKDKGTCENMEFTFTRKDKTQFTGLISGKIIIIDSTKHIISVVRDITKRKEFEQALIESEETYRSILNASPDDITITNLKGEILMISPAAKKMFGYQPEFDDFIGMQLLDFIVPEEADEAKSHIQKMYEGVQGQTNEYHGVRQDGSIFDVEVNSGFIYNAEGLPDKMVFIVRDITERKVIEEKMKKLVHQLEIEKKIAELSSITDSLTGLANRGHFDETLRMELFRLMRSKSTLSLIMLDIDFFKRFNDSYGHLAGDHCLQMIARILKNIAGRGSDLAARYGGEEFIVILPETDENGAKMIGEKIRSGIEDLAIPHAKSDIAQYVTVSVGVITVYPAELVSPDQILKLVDDALYSAKEAGRNRCVFNSNLIPLKGEK